MAGLGKQAKVLTERQIKVALSAVADRRYPSSSRSITLAAAPERLLRLADAPAQSLLGRSSAMLGRRARNRAPRHHPRCARPSPP